MTQTIYALSSSIDDTMHSVFASSNTARMAPPKTSEGGWFVLRSDSATLIYDEKIGTNISARIARLEKNPARAAALARGRQRIGRALQAADMEQQHTLAAMRLSAGLSQAKLAEIMGTQQPNIARMEKTPANLQAATVLKLARVLGVNPLKILELTEAKLEEEISHG